MENKALERVEEIESGLVEKGLKEKYNHPGIYSIQIGE